MSDTPRTDAMDTTVQGQNWGYRDMFLLAQRLERELNEEKRQFRILFDVAKTRTEERDEAKALGDERDEWRKQARELAIEVFALRDQLRADLERLKNELAKNNSAACAWDRQVAINERDQWREMAEQCQKALRGALHDGTQIMIGETADIYHWDYQEGEQALAAYEKLKSKP